MDHKDGNNMTEGIHLKPTDIVVFGGTAEEGKSYLMEHLAKSLKTRIVWDYNREHSNMGYVVYTVEEIGPALEKGLTHIVYQPLTGAQQSRQGFRTFMEEVNRLSRHYYFVLIIEEGERYAKPSNINLAKHFPNLHDLVQTGRHRGIGLWFTARIFRKLAEDITYNAHHIFAFRVHRPQDVEYIEEWIGYKANMLSSSKAERHKLHFIEKYHFLHFDRTKTVLRKPV